jgi:ABC-type phosphate transport system substrate-binding protein
MTTSRSAPSRINRSRVAAFAARRVIELRWWVVALTLILCVPSRSAVAQAFVVIVNEENPTAKLSKDDAAKYFLKRSTKWENGLPAQPIDLPENAPAREAFCATVLRRSVSAIRAYWQQQIFSGRGVPPVEKSSEAEAVAFVRANPGAIAYVSSAAAQGRGIKVITVE